MRAALYARFSTDQQSAASCADQLVACRRYAAQLGATIVGEFEDAAISGQAMGNRPGLMGLLALARAGACELVISEHTDRLSRSGGDSWAIYDDLKALGVRICTVNQGDIGTMHVGLSGTMSALMIEEIARKTKRGLEGVIASGRSAGGRTYGYRLGRAYSPAGERKRGLLEVDADEAAVVTRILTEFAGGASPRSIAAGLNADGIAGPRGGPWNASTIHGNAKRGNGIIHNELYVGTRVWGRLAYAKDRRTGARRGRPATADATRTQVPELRIVSDDLWAQVRARYAQTALAPGGRPEGARRPKRLLSGLIECGLCGGQMTRSGARDALRCHTRVERGPQACDNGRSPAYSGIEARVMAAVQANLLHPAVVETAVREFQAETVRRQRARGGRRIAHEKRMAEIDRRIQRLVIQMEEGAPWSMVADRHAALEAERVEIQGQIDSSEPDEVVVFHPAAAKMYRDMVATLSQALEAPALVETQEAQEAVRALIASVRMTPLPAHGQYSLEVVGNLAPLFWTRNEKSPLAGAFRALPGDTQSMKALGAGTGFEPVTFRL